MNRKEHLEWCKTRAIEYINNGDLNGAFVSMLSDMNKHPETENDPGHTMGMLMLMNGQLSSRQQMLKFINGFN